MPRNGGRWKAFSKVTASTIVTKNSTLIPRAPFFIRNLPVIGSGRSFGIAGVISSAGTIKLATDGRNSVKKSKNSTLPACHTIRVVISPNGLKAPPAFAATTTLIRAGTVKRVSSLPTDMMTVPITSAVVRLSATGEIKKARIPVVQNS